jgi:hypothetical protein
MYLPQVKPAHFVNVSQFVIKFTDYLIPGYLITWR